MISVKGRVQRDGDVVHLVPQEIWDLNDMLRRFGETLSFRCNVAVAVR